MHITGYTLDTGIHESESAYSTILPLQTWDGRNFMSFKIDSTAQFHCHCEILEYVSHKYIDSTASYSWGQMNASYRIFL